MLKGVTLSAILAASTLVLVNRAPAANDDAALAGGVTLLDTITGLDRFVGSETPEGLDRFRWSQRNWYDYDILTAAVVLDGSLVGAISDPASALTVFAPNDRAFQLLAYNLTGNWYFTETQVLGAIVDLVTEGEVDLTNVLTYHVVAGRVDKANVPFNVPVPTLNGDAIEFNARFFGFFVELRDSAGDTAQSLSCSYGHRRGQ